MKIVEITWIDSIGTNGIWEALEDVDKDPTDEFITIGYLLKESKKYYTLSMSLHNSEEFFPYRVGSVFRIPKGCVKKIKKFSPPNSK